MSIDEKSIDTEPSKRDLAAALHAVDNMQALLNQLARSEHAHGIAINIGVSQNRQISLYVTADDGVDELSVARALDTAIDRVIGTAAAANARAEKAEAQLAELVAAVDAFRAALKLRDEAFERCAATLKGWGGDRADIHAPDLSDATREERLAYDDDQQLWYGNDGADAALDAALKKCSPAVAPVIATPVSAVAPVTEPTTSPASGSDGGES